MKRHNVYLLFGIVLIIPLWGISCYEIVRSVQFDRNCAGLLKQAADANTIQTAKVPLSRAVAYLEQNNLTSGYTSVIYQTPDEDIGFWYRNLKASLQEIETAESTIETSTQLERSNLLMKLRETIMDGNRVTCPAGIEIFPYNTPLMILATVFVGFGGIGVVLLFVSLFIFMDS